MSKLGHDRNARFALLRHVRKLVGEHGRAGCRGRPVRVLEGDTGAERVSGGADRLRGGVGLDVGMNAYVAEIRAESALEAATDAWLERCAGTGDAA